MPIVQRSAAAARELGLTQKQYDKFISTMLDEVAGEAYVQREEAEYVAMHGGDSLKAAQKTAALGQWVNQAFSTADAEGPAAERIAANGRIARDLLRSADGRRFLESLYLGHMNQWLRSPTGKKEIAEQRSEYESEQAIKALMAAPDYYKNPVSQKKVAAYYERRYGKENAADSRERRR